MDARRVGRLAEILIVSQLRSGQSRSDPSTWTGRGGLIAYVDVLLFAATAALALVVLRLSSIPANVLTVAVNEFAPFAPLLGVGGVLIAGLMFELSTTARFSRSDAANWLPISPTEYVTASSAAIAYTYSPVIALVLGALLPIALAVGELALFLLTTVLSGVALFEGAVLIEIVRASTQRGGSGTRARHGQLVLLLRLALLAVVFLIFDLAFNPVLVLGFLERLSSAGFVSAAIPLFWSTEALIQWTGGNQIPGAILALGQLVFVGFLVVLAGAIRHRYWSPSPVELEVGSPHTSPGHPWLGPLGLSRPEAALVSKDLKGLVRRQELMTTLVLPVVLVVLVIIPGSGIEGTLRIVWIGWDAGMFALILSITSIGQERRSLGLLLAYPITARDVLRAKLTASLVPGLAGSLGMAAVVGVVSGFSVEGFVALFVLAATTATAMILWGLAFASRYSDFQDKPRPTFLRPQAMVVALLSGTAVMLLMLVPAGLALSAPSSQSWALALGAAVAIVGIGGLALHWTRTGFDRLFRESPF